MDSMSAAMEKLTKTVEDHTSWISTLETEQDIGKADVSDFRKQTQEEVASIHRRIDRRRLEGDHHHQSFDRLDDEIHEVREKMGVMEGQLCRCGQPSSNREAGTRWEERVPRIRFSTPLPFP